MQIIYLHTISGVLLSYKRKKETHSVWKFTRVFISNCSFQLNKILTKMCFSTLKTIITNQNVYIYQYIDFISKKVDKIGIDKQDHHFTVVSNLVKSLFIELYSKKAKTCLIFQLFAWVIVHAKIYRNIKWKWFMLSEKKSNSHTAL